MRWRDLDLSVGKGEGGYAEDNDYFGEAAHI